MFLPDAPKWVCRPRTVSTVVGNYNDPAYLPAGLGRGRERDKEGGERVKGVTGCTQLF